MKPNKPKFPIVYMLVCIYIVFSAFEMMDSTEISLAHKLSYAFLILVPLGLIMYSVHQRNTRIANGAFPATAVYFPLGIASFLIGIGLMFNPLFVIPAAIIAAGFVYLGVNKIRNFRRSTTFVAVDLPQSETETLEKRLPYESFQKFQAVSSPTAGGASPDFHDKHVFITRNIAFLEEEKKKQQIVAELGEGPKEIPAHFKDPDRCWCGVWVNPIAAAIQPLAWKKRLGVMPEPLTSYATLLSPNLVGSFAIPDPERSAAGLAFLAGITQYYEKLEVGEDEEKVDVWEILGSLKKNASKLLADPIDYAAYFSDPEKIAAVGFLHDLLAAQTLKSKYLVSVPNGAGWELSAAAIPAASPDKEQSSAFVDFITSKRGNEVLAAKARMLPTHPKALAPAGGPSIEAANLNPNFSLAQAQAERETLLRQWRQL